MPVADLYKDNPMFQCRHLWKINRTTKRWFCGKCKTHQEKLTSIEWTRVDQTCRYTRKYINGRGV